MDKLRALTIFSKALVRHFQGSAELYDKYHIFYEALRIIEKNGWEKEAEQAFKEEVDNIKELAAPIIEQYKVYRLNGEKDRDSEEYFNRFFLKLGVDGRERIVTDYLIDNGTSVSEGVLKEVLEKKKEIDKQNLKVFFEIQAKITRGEDFNKEELVKVTKELYENGLYRVATKLLPIAVNCDNAENLIEDYDSMFEIKLY